MPFPSSRPSWPCIPISDGAPSSCRRLLRPTSLPSPPAGRPAPPEATPTRLPSVDGAAVSGTVRAQVTDLVSRSIVELSTRSGPDDSRYFQGGVWVSGHDDCFRCNVGPGLAAAAL